MCHEALIFGAKYIYYPFTHRHQLLIFLIGLDESFQKIYNFTLFLPIVSETELFE